MTLNLVIGGLTFYWCAIKWVGNFVPGFCHLCVLEGQDQITGEIYKGASKFPTTRMKNIKELIVPISSIQSNDSLVFHFKLLSLQPENSLFLLSVYKVLSKKSN